jgi:hypothetical protein
MQRNVIHRMHRATYKMQRATYKMQRATHTMQRATHTMQRACCCADSIPRLPNRALLACCNTICYVATRCAALQHVLLGCNTVCYVATRSATLQHVLRCNTFCCAGGCLARIVLRILRRLQRHSMPTRMCMLYVVCCSCTTSRRS